MLKMEGEEEWHDKGIFSSSSKKPPKFVIFGLKNQKGEVVIEKKKWKKNCLNFYGTSYWQDQINPKIVGQWKKNLCTMSQKFTQEINGTLLGLITKLVCFIL